MLRGIGKNEVGVRRIMRMLNFNYEFAKQYERNRAIKVLILLVLIMFENTD